MNDEPDQPSPNQRVQTTRHVDRSRRARIRNALQRAWASIVDTVTMEATPTPPLPATEAIPPSTAQPVEAAPAAPAANESEAPTVTQASDDVPEPQGTTEQLAAAAHAGTASDTYQKIAQAAQGLNMVSETDAPVEPFAWSGDAPFTPEALRASAHIAADEPLQTQDIDSFFRNPTTPRDWHEDAEKEQVRGFTALRDVLKTELSDVEVYRFGSTAIEVYVVGRAANGSTLGVHTRVVET